MYQVNHQSDEPGERCPVSFEQHVTSEQVAGIAKLNINNTDKSQTFCSTSNNSEIDYFKPIDISDLDNFTQRHTTCSNKLSNTDLEYLKSSSSSCDNPNQTLAFSNSSFLKPIIANNETNNKDVVDHDTSDFSDLDKWSIQELSIVEWNSAIADPIGVQTSAHAHAPLAHTSRKTFLNTEF